MFELLVQIGLVTIGCFSLILGSVHFFFPVLLDFEHAIPRQGQPLKPFHLPFIHYPTTRQDVYGIAWVMNHAASYVLVTLGLMDILWAWWLPSENGNLLALWMAGWWFLRAGSQLYVGRRRGDWLILLGFASLGVWHVVAVLTRGTP
jgi:hypothetical protein